MLDKPVVAKKEPNGNVTAQMSPHTVWVRNDLWELVRHTKKGEGRSLKSIMNEALWYFFKYRTELEAMSKAEGFD